MLEWHDCKTDPPNSEGWYILVRNCNSGVLRREGERGHKGQLLRE